MKLIRKYKYIFALSLTLAGVAIYYLYQVVYGSNTINKEKTSILIESDVPLEQWLDGHQATALLGNMSSFRLLSKWKKLDSITAGYYTIEKDMSNNQLVNKFKGKLQDAVAIRLENMDHIYALCGRLGRKLKADSAAFADYLMAPSTLASLQTDPLNLMGFIPPNTYNFYYNTTPAAFLERMVKNYRIFWTPEKEQAAQKIGLTPKEVIILASIVKAETSKNDEAPKIAGLYLNRLRIGMKLDSDPTATYGKQLPHVDRVTSAHTSVASPFNTYHFVGLPPGPINFPETVYLEAVLQPLTHSYLFMCAQPGQTGYHNFAKNLSEHSHNAALYHRWLDANRIR
jgi:UPF0755 protein